MHNSARDTPGPWSAATEPTLRTDIYQYKYTVEISEFKEEEEGTFVLFKKSTHTRTCLTIFLRLCEYLLI